MPNLTYQYRGLSAINWPAPGFAVAPGVTSCAAPPTAALAGLATPLALGPAHLNLSAIATGVFAGPPAADATEAAWRLNACAVAATVDGAGNLVAGNAFALLDPSEKGILGYQLGSTFTTALSFGIGVPPPAVVPALTFMHLSRFLAATPPGSIVFGGPQRPDFVSIVPAGPGVWAFQVWESKGRSGAGVAIPGTLRGAFDQTQAVVTVFGAAPTGYVACMTSGAGVPGAAWRLDVTDPGAVSGTPVPPAAQDAIFREYYRPIFEMLKLAKTHRPVNYGGRTFKVAEVPGTPFPFGLHKEIDDLCARDPDAMVAGEFTSDLLSILGNGYPDPDGGKTEYANPNGLYAGVPPAITKAGRNP